MIFRLLFILLLLFGVVMFACYLVFGKTRYQHYFLQLIKVTLYLMVIYGIGVFISQLLYQS